VTQRVEHDDSMPVRDEWRHERVKLPSVTRPAMHEVNGRSIAPYVSDHLVTVDVEHEWSACRQAV
jgi:hypothetical protein